MGDFGLNSHLRCEHSRFLGDPASTQRALPLEWPLEGARVDEKRADLSLFHIT